MCISKSSFEGLFLKRIPSVGCHDTSAYRALNPNSFKTGPNVLYNAPGSDL